MILMLDCLETKVGYMGLHDQPLCGVSSSSMHREMHSQDKMMLIEACSFSTIYVAPAFLLSMLICGMLLVVLMMIVLWDFTGKFPLL